jgi:fermentation-respiration switch protein FrsA (DUF1100 family)
VGAYKKIFIFIGLLTLSGCSSIFYQPASTLFYPPENLQLLPEEIFIEVEPHLKVAGWYFSSREKTHKKPKALIVFFHGNAENMSSHYANLVWILDHGYDFFIWDYRGYWKSQGTPDPQNTFEDGIKVIQTISKKDPKLPVIIFGESLGGAIALKSVIELKKSKEDVPLKAVVIDSSFTSYKAEGRFVLSQHWLTWALQPLTYLALSDRYAPDGEIDKISPTPLLVIHGKKDAVVGYYEGEEIFKQAKDPKEFWSLENGIHTDVFWGHKGIYRTKFVEYLDKL